MWKLFSFINYLLIAFYFYMIYYAFKTSDGEGNIGILLLFDLVNILILTYSAWILQKKKLLGTYLTLFSFLL